MSSNRWKLFVIATLLLASSLASVSAEDGITVLDGAWRKAMLAGDVNGLVACYAKDAVLSMPGDPPARGEAEIRASYEGFLKAFTVKEATLTSMGTASSGDISAGWGQFTLVVAPKAGGDPVTMKGHYTGVAKKTKGKWVYVSDHASADPAPAN